MKITGIMLVLTMLFVLGLAVGVMAQQDMPGWREGPPPWFSVPEPDAPPEPEVPEPDAPPEPEVPTEEDVPPGPPPWVIEWLEGWRGMPAGPPAPRGGYFPNE